MGDMGEALRYISKHNKDIKERQRKSNNAKIVCLEKKGFIIEKKSEYHYRINRTLDVYISRNRFHDLVTNKRGGFNDLYEFVLNKF